MKDPILIGGDHRSGTTLLSLILNAHPDIVMGPELEFLDPHNLGSYIIDCLYLIKENNPKVNGQGVETKDPFYQKGVQFVRQCERFDINNVQLEIIIKKTIKQLRKSPTSFNERCHILHQLGNYKLSTNNANNWGFKIQRDIINIARYLQFWPKAKFIHVIRDGRDVATSHIKNKWDWAYKDIAEAAKQWSNIVDHEALKIYKDQIITIKYEQLIYQPLGVLKGLIKELNLCWDNALMQHWKYEHSLLNTPFEHPSADTAGHPINNHAIKRYERELTNSEITQFEQIAYQALSKHGYLQ